MYKKFRQLTFKIINYYLLVFILFLVYIIIHGCKKAEAPVAMFTADATEILEGDIVNFTDQSLNEPNVWSWTFEGGMPNTSTFPDPSVIYSSEGTYTVILSVANEGGSDTKINEDYIVVAKPVLTALFEASETSIEEGDTVYFTDLSLNNPTSWHWEFDGGTPHYSNLQNPTVVYWVEGTYNVKLSVNNNEEDDYLIKENYIEVSYSGVEPPSAPVLEFFGGTYIDEDVTVEPGAAISFSWLATKGTYYLKTFSIARDGVTLAGYPDEDIDNNNYSDQVTLEAPLNEGAYVYTFTVTDNNDKTASVSFTITVEATGGPITTWTKTLGSHQSATGASFASTTGTVYGIADAKTNSSVIDFMYFYGATNYATLAAPDDYDVSTVFASADGPANWTTRNSTRFAATSLTAGDFDAIADDLVIVEKATGASATKVNNLATGDVVAFVTDSDKSGGAKMGLVKIVSITTGAGGTITISVKVQE